MVNNSIDLVGLKGVKTKDGIEVELGKKVGEIPNIVEFRGALDSYKNTVKKKNGNRVVISEGGLKYSKKAIFHTGIYTVDCRELKCRTRVYVRDRKDIKVLCCGVLRLMDNGVYPTMILEVPKDSYYSIGVKNKAYYTMGEVKVDSIPNGYEEVDLLELVTV